MNGLRKGLKPALIVAGMAVTATVLAQDAIIPTAALMTAPAPEALAPLTVDWKAVAQHMAAVPAPQTAYERAVKGLIAERKALDALTLPILLPGPASGLDLSSARLVAMGDVYDVVVTPPATPDITYTFSATRVVMAALPGTFSRQKRDKVAQVGSAQELSIAQSEVGWTANFMRFGVLYTVSIDCLPDTPECSNDTLIRAAVSSMTEVVLGDTAEAEMNRAGFKPVRGRPGAEPPTGGPLTHQVATPTRQEELERRKAAQASASKPVKP